MKIKTPVGIALALFALLFGGIIAFGLLEPVKQDAGLVNESPVKNPLEYVVAVDSSKKPGLEKVGAQVKINPVISPESEDGEDDLEAPQEPRAPAPVEVVPAPVAPEPVAPAPVAVPAARPRYVFPTPRRTRAS